MFYGMDMRRLNILVALLHVGDGTVEALAAHLGALPELCTLAISAHARRGWQQPDSADDRWPTFDDIQQCVSQAAERGLILPTFIQGPLNLAFAVNNRRLSKKESIPSPRQKKTKKKKKKK